MVHMAKHRMHEIKFLESIENLQRVIKGSIGRKPNVDISLQISACLQQGRLFFEAASDGAAEIRPLLLSYGTIAFARAIIIARRLQRLEHLPHSHGIRDISDSSALIRDLKLRVDSDGTFQRIVDVVRDVERIALLNNTTTIWLHTPSCTAAELANKDITLLDVLSRIPDLSELYRETFSTEPNVMRSHVFQRHGTPIYDLRMDVPATSAPLVTDILRVLGEMRRTFPFLNHLNFAEAWFAWDHIGMNFDNIAPGGLFPRAEADVTLNPNNGRFCPTYERPSGDAGAIALDSVLPPSHGGMEKVLPAFSAPLHGVNLSEFTLFYLGTYLMGSAVRYRPQTWVHALQQHSTVTRPRDDAALAIVEQFLSTAQERIPAFCVQAIRAPVL